MVEPLIVISSTVNEVRVPRLVIPLCAASTDNECAIPSPEVAPVEVRPVPAVNVPTKLPVVSVPNATESA